MSNFQLASETAVGKHKSVALMSKGSTTKHHASGQSTPPTVLVTPTKFLATSSALREDDLPAEVLGAGTVARRVYGSAQSPEDYIDGEMSTLTPSVTSRLLTLLPSPEY